MAASIFEDFASAAYAVHCYPFYGCWRIVRRADQAMILLMTGTEGLAEYRALKAAFRRRRARFDALCAAFAFEPV